MAVTHIVTFVWVEGMEQERVATIHETLQAFIARGEGLEGLVAWRGGADLSLAEGNADFGVWATFDDRAAYERYRDHPEHRRIITEMIAPYLVSRSVVQFEH